jgi:N-acetylmuramoyl-L-alanine amidase
MARLMWYLLLPWAIFFSSISIEAASTTSLKPFRASIPQHAKPLVILDPGHGGSDEGAKINFFHEKRITLLTTLALKKYLEEKDYRVILTRSRDVFVSLERRVSIANKTRAVIFVSIHYNASHSADAKGIEVFYYKGRNASRAKSSKQLADNILSHLIKGTEADSRGVKAGNFHVIRETDMPAVLVEGGFITNKEERMLLRDKTYLNRVAAGIADGIDHYLRKNAALPL